MVSPKKIQNKNLHKKTPNDIFARMFDYPVLDMLEVAVEKAVSMAESKVSNIKSVYFFQAILKQTTFSERHTEGE
jgi:hypothetical protein